MTKCNNSSGKLNVGIMAITKCTHVKQNISSLDCFIRDEHADDSDTVGINVTFQLNSNITFIL